MYFLDNLCGPSLCGTDELVLFANFVGLWLNLWLLWALKSFLSYSNSIHKHFLTKMRWLIVSVVFSFLLVNRSVELHKQFLICLFIYRPKRHLWVWKICHFWPFATTKSILYVLVNYKITYQFLLFVLNTPV